ncbi:hypothetical protein [Falsihalocynthiibacter arcticus]|uniref:Uncharacterized protein n=1 Tax=Falsihalocynthiibacter arcticus TaxID=1579316 RepID=A0A126V347_9RHOB|nr:hypothetical protein [Falsihalocynthiibacter arcticus]AML52577.1 hypothetical protein RC74_16040 [Falsihalocynthiibacter arcticus]
MQHQLEHFSVVPATKDPQNQAASPHQKTSKVNADLAFNKKRQVPKLEETLSSVSVNWYSIEDLGPRIQQSTIRKLVKLAVEAGKKTVTIENIAIYNPYDVNSAAKVLSAKKEVVFTVGKSVKRLLHTRLVNRLFLDGDRFGVRFYLNEEHPTDYSHLPCER